LCERIIKMRQARNNRIKGKIIECDYENCSGRSTFVEGTGVVLGKKNFCRPVCRDLYQKREDEKLTGQEEGVQA